MKPIAITMGDPAGIGPEIIAKAFRDASDDLRNCFVAGDLATLRRAAQSMGDGLAPLPIAHIERIDEATQMPPRCVPVLQVLDDPADVPWGKVDARAGRMAAQCVVWAAHAALERKVAALVTGPLHKEALAAAGVSFPGHTELLQAEAAKFAGRQPEEMPVRMMLANEELRTVLVSIHVSLRDAITAVTRENVERTIRIAHDALAPVLGRGPRIAVAGLNPHAGEGGLFGREEIDVIAPAVLAARSGALDVHGPFAPDTIFMRARRDVAGNREFDVVVAMYHDQGLIPVKYLGVEQGVNVTLGLPLIRTSPDHGTAVDIAGTGRADPSSLIAAVRMARELAAVGAPTF